MRVLVVGSGGREHALVSKIAQSGLVSEVLCAPGNGGTAQIARNCPVDVESVAALTTLAREEAVDFVVIGPEAPLVLGAADALREAGVLVFGPGREAAQLEGSKAFAKAFIERHGLATAAARVFEDAVQAHAYLDTLTVPPVIKADGLAAGKGVVVAQTIAEAHAAVDAMMGERAFGEAGATVVIEERLVGQEVSFHVVLDGSTYVPLVAAQDHKAVGDGDTGPNTGGMGAYSPPPVVTPDVEQRILQDIVEPTVQGLKTDGLTFRGVLFIGLMIVEGVPYVLEYNVRFGDPETQVLLARWGGDVLPLLLGAAKGTLQGVASEPGPACAMCVVLTAPGYPGSYPKGAPIAGLDQVATVSQVNVIHAGTRVQDGAVVTAGGRVLGVTAAGATVDEVAQKAYRAIDQLHFDGMHFRRDIGHHARSK